MKALSIILITFLHLTAFGQGSSLVGQLTNESTCDRALAFWKVTLSDDNGVISSSETGIDGEFQFDNLTQKPYNLRVSFPTYLKNSPSFFDTTLYPIDTVKIAVQTNIHGNLTPKFDEKKELFGYVDNEGNYIIEPQFRVAEPFNCGIAKVYFKKAKMHINQKGWHYIHLDGQIAMPPRQESKLSEMK